MSEKYEGLNLPQLLDRMHNIVEPEPVAMTPQTDGWLLILGWAAVVAVLSVSKFLIWRRRNRYRREALAELEQIDFESPSAAADIAGVVKRAALVAYVRGDVASLTGVAWANFLIESSGNDSRIKDSAIRIAEAPYRPGVDASEILGTAKLWVKVHRA